MNVKRWTLAVVSAATAMLMLDIAVVNTALPRIAEDLDTGLGGAILFAVSLSLLANAYPDQRERAGALAVYGATIAGSFAIGPLVGGVLTSALDWQWVFLINIPIGLACLAITRWRVEESSDPAARRIDWAGLVTLTGGLSLLVLALLRGNEDGWGSLPIVAELSGAVLLLGAVVAIESRVREPMLPLGFFRDRSFTGAQIGAFAISGSFFAVFIYATLYLQQILGLSPVEAGLVYVPGTVAMFAVSGATASLMEKVGPGPLVAAGLALVGVGMAMMTAAGASSSWTAVLPGLIVGMIGTGLFNPAVIAVGVAGLGALVPAGAAFGDGSPASYVAGLQDALLVGAGLALAGAVACALLIARRGPAATADPAPVVEPIRAG